MNVAQTCMYVGSTSSYNFIDIKSISLKFHVIIERDLIVMLVGVIRYICCV